MCYVEKLALLLAAVLGGALLSGCGSEYGATASGKVTVAGESLARGTVMFHPQGSEGSLAHAVIADDGSYSVSTGREVGLRPGDYVVTVVAHEPPKQLYSAAGGPPVPGELLTPLRYRNAKTSDLKFTVERGSNAIDLELTARKPGR